MRMSDSTPICRCRVLYLGSAVPRQSKDGLQGIQEPLRSLYPSEGAIGAKGIDSWLSVWSNGVLLENVDENRKQVTRFFPIDSLHYCAAVRQVLIPERGNSSPEPKFLPLDSPFARTPKAQHPPIFAAILRRTTGIKVLECHVFICKREAAANALVRCCFHAYADNSYARQLENGSTSASVYGTLSKPNGEGWRSRAGSTTTLNSSAGGGGGGGGGGGLMGRPQPSTSLTNELGEAYTVKNLYASSADLDVVDDGEASIYNGDENHKVWSGSTDQLNGISSLEGPYDIYSGPSSTLGRPSRQRQISAPVPVLPPPKEDVKKKSSSSSKDKSKRHSLGSQSLSGTLIRPKPIHASSMTLGRPMPPQGYQNGGGGHHPGHPGHPGHMIYGPLPPPHMMNGGGGPPRQYHSLGRPLNGYMNGGPGGPPPGMIPMPMPHPHHMMMPAQYATLQHPRAAKGKKHKKDKYNGMPPLGIPVPTPMFHAYPPPPASQMHAPDQLPRPLGMSSRKLAQSAAAGLDDSGNSGAESPNGTGIYRRKGHLNERAFSYSIRQEHRSRSHGSLASLQFNPPDLKKEREIAQMVAGLDLNEQQAQNGSAHHHHRRSQMNGHAGAAAAVGMNGNANGMPMMAGGPGGSSGTFGKPRR